MTATYTFKRIEREKADIESIAANSPLGGESIKTQNEVSKYLAKEFAFLWAEFEASLSSTPIISAIENETITLEEYKTVLLNMRQQVIDGGRWIALGASSIDIRENSNYAFIRERILTHAGDEQSDYKMLENNYLALGGDRGTIEGYPQNIGTEAFTAYMFHRASQPNPLDLLGALFIIEGVGKLKASPWADHLHKCLDLNDDALTFLRYHGKYDFDHMEKFRLLISLPIITMDIAKRMVKTTKVVAALYVLQFAHMDDQ